LTPGPNLFVVGAAKAGTTSLWRHLDAHPDIFMSRVKEPHFFSRGGMHPVQVAIKDPAAYAQLFERGAKKRYRGEASPSYLWDPDTPGRIEASVEDARIIVSLRDPVERAWSNYVMASMIGTERRSFERAIEDELAGLVDPADQPPPYLHRGRYAEQLERYLDRFGDRTTVVWFEEFAQDVRATMRTVFERLGVDPRPASRLDPAPVVPHLEARNSAARAVFAVPGARRAGLALLRGRALRLAQWALLHHPKPELDHRVRARLREEFARDDDRLRALVGRSLPWDGHT
jgi:hypothetical protein